MRSEVISEVGVREENELSENMVYDKFDVRLVHTPGTKMIQSDALSQRPDLCLEEDTNNKNIVMLPEEMFVNLIDVDLQERIAAANDLDGNAAEMLRLNLETKKLRM
jgi:hypothetical protein